MNSGNLFSEEQVEIVDEDTYDLFRYMYQVPQWQECKDSIPSKMNFDLLGSVDLKKGCFVGQELTARTQYTGVVRKRPFLVFAHSEKQVPQLKDPKTRANVGLKYLNPTFNVPLAGRTAKDSSGRDALKVIGSRYNYCLALFEYMDANEHTFKGEEGIYYTVLDPEYLGPELATYKSELAERLAKQAQF